MNACAIICSLFAVVPLSHAQLSTPTVLPGDTALAPPAGDQANVAFARGDDTTLMVWEDRRADLTGTQSSQGTAVQINDIYAARIDDAGNTLDSPPIVVTQAAFSQTVPKVAWNGESWLVVWTTRTPGPSFSTQGVYGVRISAAGQILDDPPIRIADTTGFDERVPVVASDGDSWAVIWFANIAFGIDGVRGCLVSSAGTVDAPRTLFQTTGGVNFYVPTNFELAWAGGRYLLVSEHLSPSTFDSDIFGQLFDASLNKVGPEFAVATNTPWNQRRPAVASNGTGFFVTWHNEQLPDDVRGTPVSPSGVVAVPNGTVFAVGMGGEPQPAAGWDGVDWIAAWESGGPGLSGSSIQVARVSGAGAMRPGSPFAASAGTWSMERPAIATLAGGALVGWSDLRNVHFFFSNSPAGIDTTDLYGAVVDASGSMAADRPLLLSPPAQTRPDLAGNATSGYLVAFLSETAGTASVMAQRVDAFGAPIDPQPTVVATGTRLIRNPVVAFDGTVWLVTWEQYRLNGSAGTADVFARRVSSNGIPIDPAPILVMSGNTPDVAAVGGVFLVVSSTQPGHFRSIHGARVRGSDGALLDTTPIFIGTYYSVDPAVTAFADRWLVAWQQHPTHDNPSSSIQASFVLSSGAAVAQFQVSTSGRAPSVASGGSIALVSWNDSSDVRARRIRSDGTTLDTSAGFVVSNASNRQFSPESGWDGASWFVAWNDYRAHTNVLDGGVGDLYGSRVEADGTISDPSGVAVANDFAVPECNPAVAGDRGTTLTAYAMIRSESQYGTFRITLRARSDEVGTHYCTAKPNSTGAAASISLSGSASAAANHMRLECTEMPLNTVGYFLTSTTQGYIPNPAGSSGNLCLGGSIGRYASQIMNSGATGSIGLQVDLASIPTPTGSVAGAPGQSWSFQCWFRDAAGDVATSNFSNGVAVTLQ